MKKLIILLLVFVQTAAWAQKPNVKTEVVNSLNHYSQMLENGNVDSALNIMYPKFFEFFPREGIAEAMKAVFNDTMVGFSFGKFDDYKLSKVVKDKGIQYVLVTYKMQARLYYKKPMADNPTQEESTFNLAAEVLKQQYGEDAVKSDFATRSFYLTLESSMFAINDPKYGNKWWFIEKKDDMKEYVIDKIIPAKVWAKFSKGKKKK